MMPLPLPQTFDENEWFVIISLIISFSFVFWLPKRFPLSLTILIMLLGSIIARLHDHLLSSPDLDLYDIMDSGKYEFFDAISYCLYAPFSYIFIYMYDRLNVRGFWIWFYIIVWSFGGTMFEGLTVVFNVFNYSGWKLTYSFSVYLITQSLTLLLYHIINHFHKLLTSDK